ncbi:hypothetical protein Q5H92_14905 [Hymenobacter sp. M29]|uniref:Uncharacterized protein n=1 Tax=Hymenobacter mellowenesis TaxID=3063995 RepID=A0ABT9AF94_9BACT|nr:hypothetical protein [Hymenobacter sp. M29]MDO7847656.1 hypothetical protein [Hymenobacter sp. M29]
MNTPEDQDLVGKYVLYESGMSFDKKLSRAIKKIEKVTKTGYRISGLPDTLFDFKGQQKGLTGKMNMATVSRCTLLTDEEANALSLEWGKAKRRRALLAEVLPLVEAANLDQLLAIQVLLTKL